MLAIAVSGLMLWQRPAISKQAQPAVKWDYTSVAVEANALPAKLMELGNDGWEVFSIERSEMKVAPGDGGIAQIVAVTYEVSARKPR